MLLLRVVFSVPRSIGPPRRHPKVIPPSSVSWSPCPPDGGAALAAGHAPGAEHRAREELEERVAAVADVPPRARAGAADEALWLVGRPRRADRERRDRPVP